ncbi:MAG: CPBP family intramembrane metalloprotease [Anaerolineales bacterium]|nr:MAG: CPBP family intramembrane metalloprotease [Anaerolineales bacterium]
MATKNLSWIKRNSLVLYFILAYAISWSLMIPVALVAQGLVKWQVPYALYYLASFGPMVAALLITAIAEGATGVRRLLGRLLIWRVGAGHLAFTLLAPFALFILAVLLNRLVLGSWPDVSLLGKADYLPYLGPLGVFGVWLLTYGLGEEVGWRGFALPRLQRNHTAGNATLILAALWACWHLPAIFFRDTYVDLGVLAFPMLFVSIIFATAVFTWLYNSTGGSLLMVVLFHAIFNWLSVSEAGGQFSAILMSVPIILWAIFVMRRYGPENAAQIKRQMA